MAPPRPAMRRGQRRASLLAATLALLVAATASVTQVDAQELCQTLKACKREAAKDGDCDRTKQACPPCMYLANGGAYSCFDKTTDTNTCPYTGVIYDCAGVNYGSTGKPSSSSSSSSTTNTTAAPSSASSSPNATSTATTADAAATAKSPVVMYAAIGGGALLVIILLVFVVMRRRRRGRNMPKFADSPQVFNTKRGAKTATANTPYTNMPNTSKGPGSYPQRKFSDPVLLESSAVMMGAHHASSDYSGNTATDSLDGMLAMDNTPPPAVLGDPLPRTRSKRGFSNGFKRLNSGGSSKRSSSTYDMKTPVKGGPNVFGEYLKMKKDFDSDAMSDYGSDMMSLDRFSVSSASTVGGGGHGMGGGGHNVLAMSITDSEYQADLMRSRTESECFSEMSYNDEKYSFSDDTDSVLAASIVRQPPKRDKEVEI